MTGPRDDDDDNDAPSPASCLEGIDLPNGWHVEQRLEPGPSDTGGTFSESYIVRREDGTSAFLKAFDYSAALQTPNTAETLLGLTSAYLFERDLLAECAGAKMSRVVLALDSGEVDVPGYGVLSRVNYLIFEEAEHDSRRHRELMSAVDAVWSLRALHHVATGLDQLHRRKIAHQDTKPSNVLVFKDKGSKLGDLGRAGWEGHDSPWDGTPIAGDVTYAPPEQLYRHVDLDTLRRQRACDAYHLGSMALFMFSGVGTTGALAAELPDPLRWGTWTESYEAVLPYLVDAFERIADRFRADLPESFGDALFIIFKQLCDPDVDQRGDPTAKPGTRQRASLTRFVSRLDLLARDEELGIRRRLRK
jgi:serine/threonine protein kinase